MMNNFQFTALTLMFISLGACKQGPEKAIRNYISVKGWQERLPLVRDPEHIGPLMKEYFGNDGGYNVPAGLLIKCPQESPKDGRWFDCPASVTGKNAFGMEVTQNWATFVLRKRGDRYEIDWGASEGHNPMSWKAFKAQKPTMSMTFRVRATLSDYYNWEFAGFDAKRNYWSVQLTPPDDDSGLGLYGYIEKRTEDGSRLHDLLQDGEEHAVTLNIEFKPNSDPGGNVVYIAGFVTDGWVRDHE